MRDYRQQTAGLRGAAKGLREIDMPKTAEQMDDAADAIEELLRKIGAKDSANEFGRKRIENLQAENEELLAKVPHWISVEERLPEDGKDVLCWYEYYHWNKEKMLPEYGIGYCINGHWGGEVSNGRDCKVLYWMPLPKAPEPPEEDE